MSYGSSPSSNVAVEASSILVATAETAVASAGEAASEVPVPVSGVRRSVRAPRKRVLEDNNEGEAIGNCICGKRAAADIEGNNNSREVLVKCTASDCETVWVSFTTCNACEAFSPFLVPSRVLRTRASTQEMDLSCLWAYSCTEAGKAMMSYYYI